MILIATIIRRSVAGCRNHKSSYMVLHFVVWVSAWPMREDEGTLHLTSIEVRNHVHGSVWHYRPDVEEGVKRLHDWRTGEEVFSNTPLDPVELNLLTFPRPSFSEYSDLIERIRALLRHCGYGDLT